MTSHAARRWNKHANVWYKRLKLTGRTILYVFNEEDVDIGHGNSTFPTMAVTRVKPQYRQASIEIHKPWLKDAPEDEVEDAVVHELLHVAMGPVMDWAHELLTSLPAAKREGYEEWWHRANEEVTVHLTDVLRSKKYPA